MRTFGICMQGCEQPLENLLRDSVGRFIANGVNDRAFAYLEVGTAYGVTLMAVSSILHESLGSGEDGKDWMAVGLDIPGGWSLDLVGLRRAFVGVPFKTREHLREESPPRLGLNLYLCPSVRFLTQFWHSPVDFALIDGCHCAPCVKADFEAVAGHCLTGSVVVFHDAAKDEESPAAAESENHGVGIKVYTAIQELGLLENHPEWKQLDWIAGDKTGGLGYSGNSCAVFVKR